jgi:hypothetical protein
VTPKSSRAWTVPPDHLLFNSAPILGRLISRWEINKFKNCWYKSVRILEVLKLLFQQFLSLGLNVVGAKCNMLITEKLNWNFSNFFNLSSSQQYMSGPILGDLSNNRWSKGIFCVYFERNYIWFCLPYRNINHILWTATVPFKARPVLVTEFEQCPPEREKKFKQEIAPQEAIFSSAICQ